MSLFRNFITKTSVFPSSIFSIKPLHTSRVQLLYSPAALGVDGYLYTRKKIKDQFSPFADKFKLKMEDFIKDEKSMIFTEDLKNIIHIAEPVDLDLVLKMIKKFNCQNSEYRFGSFVFGPVVMRMFHFLDAPKEALKCLEDTANETFFDQQASYHILLDLLYKNEMYDDMYRVFERIQEKQINMTKYPKYPVVLVLAACYKQNTPKSMEYASKMYSEMSKQGTVPLRRAVTLFAGLALKQGSPHIALEVISTQKQQHYVTTRNIKVVALAQLGRFDESLPILRSVLQIDDPDQKDKHTFFDETVSQIKEVVEKSHDKDAKVEFQNIEKALRDRNLIENKTLEELLTAEITLGANKSQEGSFSATQKRMPFAMRQKRSTY